MKKIFVFFILFVCAIASAQTFNSFEEAAENQLAYTPIDLRGFLPLSSKEETILFTGVFHGQTAGGYKFAWLKNELVVVDKATKKINRIYRCGNRGDFTPWEAEKDAPTSTKMEIIHSGEVDVYHHFPTLELAIVAKKLVEDEYPQKEKEISLPVIPSSSWTGWQTVSVIVGGLAGGFTGGYLFQKENVNVATFPGVSFRSGDGTWLFSPDRTEVTTSKEGFNPLGATIGIITGIGLTYALNKLIF